MSTDGQGTKWRRNIAENFNRLSRVLSARTLQTTDRRKIYAVAYSEGEREFTFTSNIHIRYTQPACWHWANVITGTSNVGVGRWTLAQHWFNVGKRVGKRLAVGWL